MPDGLRAGSAKTGLLRWLTPPPTVPDSSDLGVQRAPPGRLVTAPARNSTKLAAARPFTKAAYRIGAVEDIGFGVARAIRTAVSGRPGGVYLDVPREVLDQVMEGAHGARSRWAPHRSHPEAVAGPKRPSKLW